jgi:hypothetical protein
MNYQLGFYVGVILHAAPAAEMLQMNVYVFAFETLIVEYLNSKYHYGKAKRKGMAFLNIKVV